MVREREREGDAQRELNGEADGRGQRQADRDTEKRLEQTKRNAGKSARLLQIFDRT